LREKSWRGETWFLLGIFAIFAFPLWCFCGEVVVKCVANVVRGMSFVVVLKTGQAFEVYFQG
jgi:hypothetical protein